MTGPESTKGKWRPGGPAIGLAVLAVSLLLRFLYLPHIQELPTFDHPVMDAAYHDNWAREVAGGTLTRGEPFFRAPLYPYALGLGYAVSGGSYTLPRVLQFLLGGLTALLTYLLARRLLGDLAAAVAGFMAAVYPVLIYFEGELLTETLFIFLLMLALYLMTLAAGSGRGRTWFLGGLCLGGALITRPIAALFVPFAAIGALLPAGRRLRNCGVLILGVLIMLAPVTLHNAAVSGEFIPLVWQGGLNFYLGNNGAADGWSATSPELRKDWWGGYKDMTSIPQQELGRELLYGEISDYWTRRGIDFIRSHPVAWMRLMLKKAALFWGSREFPNNLDYNFMKTRSWVLKNPLVAFSTVAPVAILGLILLAPRARRLYFLYSFLFAFFAGTVAFFVCSRYRAPVLPVLMIFAGGAVAQVLSYIRARAFGRLALSALLLAAAAVLVNLNPAGEDLPGLAQSYSVLANVYREKGDLDRAAQNYRAAIEENPLWGEGYEGLGLIAMERGDRENAEKNLIHAVKVEPDRAVSYRTLAMLYISEGELGRAREAIEAALEHAPYLEDNHNLLGTIERQEGNLDEAIKLFEQEIELNPLNWRAHANLGSVYDEAGQMDKAIEAYKHAAEIAPDEPGPLLGLAGAYARTGRESEARAIMDRLERAPSGDLNVQYNRAVLLQNQGRTVESEAIYRQILSIDPGHEGALVNLGVICARMGRDEEAIRLWERALESNPENANAFRNLRLLKERMEGTD